ncbi:MAG: terminase gpA endonuclease subunit, partial [Pseudomonadota bacterium]
ESIDGEGDGFTLMRARTRSFMSRGSAVVESSPGAPLTDETWRAQTIHDCPPVKYGVLALYPQGSRARWYWTCPSGCGHEFEPHRDLLKFSDKGTPEERGKTAEMMCPGCGSLFGHEHKVALNQSGRWLHETEDGKSAVPLAHPDMRQTDVLSYWLNGAAAAFSTWAELITQELNAIAHFEATGDEGQLRTAMNTGQAMPYFPRGASDESEIHLQLLKDKAATVKTEKGIAPTWARYLTVSVDTQGTRFDVGVTAWGEDGRHQPIDRFDLFEPPADAPGAGDRTLRPFDIAEDWAVLNGLTAMVWPVEGAEYGLKPAALAVDMQGGGATTENAYRFYRERRRAGEGRLWHLTRGSGGHHTDRIWMKAPERARGGRKVASDIKILNMATDRLKDAVGSSLRIKTDGQNICIVPYWMTEPQLIEMTAERRTAKGWEKRPGMQRNESLDHLVQARALHIKLRGEKIDWANPPSFAVGGLANEFAVAIGRDGEAQPDGAGAKKHQRGVVGQRIGYLSRG